MRPLLALAAATALSIAFGGNSPTSPSLLPFNPTDFSATAFLARGTFRRCSSSASPRCSGR
jgi:hypothetical protein